MNSLSFVFGRSCRSSRGFTLMELLVVIAITAVLVILSVMLVANARKRAWAAQSTANLRQCALAIQGYLDENGRYPECYDFPATGAGSGGGPWSWQIRDYIGYSTTRQWPVNLVLNPRHGIKGIDALTDPSRQGLHHYAASAIVLQDVDENNNRQGKKYIRPANITNPARLFMLGDAPLKTKDNPASGCHAAWWDVRWAVSGSPESNVDNSVVRREMDFWLRGKGQFLFVDGHVETLGPKEIKKKHFQL